ncbi:MAG TPA: glutathione S-transferase family protein [Polyangiaceae bacterium]
MLTLYVIHHSPWSERARWALLHHKKKFEEREHVPLVGELALRMRAKNTNGKVSVPLLVAEDGASVQGSLAIGEWVDARGKQKKLFPEGGRERIVALYEALEDPLSAGRERFVRDLTSDREAQLESLPPFLRALPFATLSARVGTAFVASKYNARIGSVDDRMRAGLRALREALAGKPYVLDDFSFGDIVGTSIVQAIRPCADEYLDFPPATRRLWEHPKLLKEFPELVEWRDAVYAKHRPKR